jgi:hypothetical protein
MASSHAIASGPGPASSSTSSFLVTGIAGLIFGVGIGAVPSMQLTVASSRVQSGAEIERRRPRAIPTTPDLTRTAADFMSPT